MLKLIFASNLLFLLVFYIEAQQRSYNSTIESPKITDWGSWGNIEFCAYPHYAIGFRSKVQSCGSCDQTAMNGIQLQCSDGKKISSAEGSYGNWASNFSTCKSNGKLIGFQVKVEENQYIGDDTATNSIKMLCSTREVLSSLEGNEGHWSIVGICPQNTSICGIQTQIELDSWDVTSLNNVKFYCCG